MEIDGCATDNVYEDGSEDGACDSRTIFRLLDTTNKLLVVVLESGAQDRQYNDGKD